MNPLLLRSEEEKEQQVLETCRYPGRPSDRRQGRNAAPTLGSAPWREQPEHWGLLQDMEVRRNLLELLTTAQLLRGHIARSVHLWRKQDLGRTRTRSRMPTPTMSSPRCTVLEGHYQEHTKNLSASHEISPAPDNGSSAAELTRMVLGTRDRVSFKSFTTEHLHFHK